MSLFGKKKDPDERLCPFMRCACVGAQCRLWIKVVGLDPQTGRPIDNYNCTFAWWPTLQLENSQMQRQTGAAVESFRNEMAEVNRVGLAAQAAALEAMAHASGQHTLPARIVR